MALRVAICRPSYVLILSSSSTYDHRRGTLPDPVCSPHVKPSTGGLVVRWVTTGEYPLLYVFAVPMIAWRAETFCLWSILFVDPWSASRGEEYLLMLGPCSSSLVARFLQYQSSSQLRPVCLTNSAPQHTCSMFRASCR